VNIYSYVKNDPVIFRDPLGLLDPIVYQDPKMYPIDPQQARRISNCYNKNKFSAMASDIAFGGDPTAKEVIGYIEIGSLSSLTSDSVAIARKAAGTATTSSNTYASGINMIGKDVTRGLGYPRIFGSPLMKYVHAVGDRASFPLAIVGAGTFGYNVGIDAQCLCGVID